MNREYPNGNVMLIDWYNFNLVGEGGYCGTITTGAAHCGSGIFLVIEETGMEEIYDKALNQVPKDSNIRIRKLTPKECWRLMGFDDAAFERAAAVNSNTQLYKQAGNSIVVDVLMNIFKEMI